MKKAILAGIFCFLAMGGGFLGAQDSSPAGAPKETPPEVPGESSGGETGNSWQMPGRIFEFGFDLDVGFGNSLIKFEDIFNFRKTLLIDLSAMSPGEFFVEETAAASAFINLNLGTSWNFGIFAGAQIDAYQSAPEEFTELLRRGNVRTKSITVGMTGAAGVFMDAGIKAETRRDKLRFLVKPAAYTPLLYMPQPDMNVDITMADTGLVLMGSGDVNLYSAVSLEQLMGEDKTTDINELLSGPIPLGFDISLGGSYFPLPALELGLDIANIPLFPALLRYHMHQELRMEGDWSDMYTTLTSGDFEIPEIKTAQSYNDNAAFTVFRPLRFDFFAAYRPVVIDLFVIRPHIGFSLLTVFGYDTACFNAGLDGHINIANIFGLSLGTGYHERLWKHALGVRLNFRAVELNAELSLKGPDLMSSFKGRGLGAAVGIRLGF
jgi:hypothetical protein